MNILLKNGIIVDGKRTPAFRGDLLIEDGRIKKIFHVNKREVNELMPDTPTNDLTGPNTKTVDITGKVVCPGFIDTHSHMDVQLLHNPYQNALIRQGITTSLLGQDGISMAPLPKEWIEKWRTVLGGLDGDTTGLELDYESVEGYLKLLKKSGISTNAAYLVTHGNIRLSVMGMDNRIPSEEEIEKMKSEVDRAMREGAIGLSSGLIYVPCAYSMTEEIIELCKVVAKYDGIFVVHQRSEADDILNSMDEIIRIGRESGVKIHFSHFKACGKNTWDKIDSMLEKIDLAKAWGINISFDQYPYVAGSTTLLVVLPPWVQDGGPDKMFERMQNPEDIARMREEIEGGAATWDNFVDFAGWEGIYLTYIPSKENARFVGKNLQEMADELGMNPLDATIKLLLEEKAQVSMVDFYGKEEHVRRLLCREEQNICTDGIVQGTPHPRAYGTYPRIMGKYVRAENVLSLEDAVYKATYKAASVMGIEKDRGHISEGAVADLVVFEPDTIIDRGTYENPIQYPDGIELVMVNGNIVLDNGKCLEGPFGQVILRGGGVL